MSTSPEDREPLEEDSKTSAETKRNLEVEAAFPDGEKMVGINDPIRSPEEES
ncbi:hypothetical protein AB0I35_30770 [Nocardia sp. NPDC050378]|uniref:hypothetical protein n=1 Tax=Nocardia sp. NPDC050378 TaxID=3155400 RepID=UPI003411C61C